MTVYDFGADDGYFNDGPHFNNKSGEHRFPINISSSGMETMNKPENYNNMLSFQYRHIEEWFNLCSQQSECIKDEKYMEELKELVISYFSNNKDKFHETE